MKRRSFLKKTALATAASFIAPYILPSGRLFASTGSRVVNHVVFVLFAGGVRNQESVGQQFVSAQTGFSTSGNLMNNMLSGAAPSSNFLFTPWAPVLSTPLATQGCLFPEMQYTTGPTGHYNGHTVAMTGNYTNTGLNLNINPEMPTLFEYYRKHNDPVKSALNAWWISEGLGPYPSLNYSRHPMYGPQYGANFINPATVFDGNGNSFLSDAKNYQPDDVGRIHSMRDFLNKGFHRSANEIPGIQNSEIDKQAIKSFMAATYTKLSNNQFVYPTPGGINNGMTGDLSNIAYSWEVLNTFKPELTVINTFNLDTCHSDFGGYLQFLHKADYGIGWLWDKIQSTPGLANDTVLICMPEHGRNLQPNAIYDSYGLRAFDHTSDQNSRRMFGLIVGPTGKIKSNQQFGSSSNPIGESIDIVPTIAHLLGFDTAIPANFLPGRVLSEVLV